MAVRLSTGLRNAMLDTGSFKSAMNAFFIDAYTGSQPASADAAPGATLLRTYSVGGDGSTGATWGAASSGTISRTTSEVLSGTAVTNGVIGWVRIRLAGDDNSSSVSAKRIDMGVGSSGSTDVGMISTTVASGDLDIWGVLSLSLPVA